VPVEETTGTWWEGAHQLEERFAGLDMTLLCNRKGPTLFPDAQQGVQTLSQMYAFIVTATNPPCSLTDALLLVQAVLAFSPGADQDEYAQLAHSTELGLNRVLTPLRAVYPEAYTLEARKTHPKEKLLHPSCGPYVLTLALPPVSCRLLSVLCKRSAGVLSMRAHT
jgi:hypothetical protein